MDTLELQASDGARSAVLAYRSSACASEIDHDTKATAVVLVLPAMGVKARFYRPLGDALAKAGMHALLFDLRGTGSSRQRASRRVDFGYATMLQHDLPSALALARAQFPFASPVLLGHSLGGQLACLHQATCAADERAAAVVLAAAGSVYYRAFSGPERWAVLAGTQVCWGLSAALGYFPGEHLGFGGRQARTVIRDWAQFARTGVLTPRGLPAAQQQSTRRSADAGGTRSAPPPTLAISFAQDRYAPESAVDHLATLACGPVERWHLGSADLDPSAPAPNHFSWVRHSQPLAQRLADWLRQQRLHT